MTVREDLPEAAAAADKQLGSNCFEIEVILSIFLGELVKENFDILVFFLIIINVLIFGFLVKKRPKLKHK